MSSQGWVTMWTYWHSMDLYDSTSSIFCQAFEFIFAQNSSSIFVLRQENKWLTNSLPCIIIIRHLRECWNGRQARLRCVWLRRVGSSPISRTKKKATCKSKSLFSMISVPFGHGWYTLPGMISADADDIRCAYEGNGYYIMLAKQVYHAAQAVYHIASAIYHWKNTRNPV